MEFYPNIKPRINLKLHTFNHTVSKSLLCSSILSYHFEKYSHLFNDIKGKFQPLFLEHWNQMQEKNWKMFMAITERNENCHLQNKRVTYVNKYSSKP